MHVPSLGSLLVTTPPDAGRRDVLERIRSLHPSLSVSAQRVADVVLTAPADVLPLSASRLAAATDTSVGTVVRFCHAVGCPGYQDFKDALSASTVPDRDAMVRHLPTGTVDTVLHTTLVSIARAAEAIDVESVAAAARRVRGARRILIPSAGPSQPLAMAFAQMLQHDGYGVSHPWDVETQVAIAQQLTDEDVCFAISHSGTTEQTLKAARVAQASGAHVLALTSHERSELAQLAEVAIVTGAPTDDFRSSDRASRPLHLAVLQSLVAVLEHGDA